MEPKSFKYCVLHFEDEYGHIQLLPCREDLRGRFARRFEVARAQMECSRNELSLLEGQLGRMPTGALAEQIKALQTRHAADFETAEKLLRQIERATALLEEHPDAQRWEFHLHPYSFSEFQDALAAARDLGQSRFITNLLASCIEQWPFEESVGLDAIGQLSAVLVDNLMSELVTISTLPPGDIMVRGDQITFRVGYPIEGLGNG